MKTATINDLFVIHTRSKLKAKEGKDRGLYPFYTSGNSKSFLDTFQHNTKGLIIGKGGNPNWHFAFGKFSYSTDCCMLTNKQQLVDVEYVYYYFCAFPSVLQRLYKGAGIKHISVADIKEIEIPYPSEDVQRTIVTVLSFLDEIIGKRKKCAEMLPEVLFHYYLGIINDKLWDDVRISDIATNVKTGPFGTQLHVNQFRDNGEIYVLGIDDITKNKSQKRYLPISDLEKYNKYLVNQNDVLVSIMGTVGRSIVVPDNIGLAINTKHLVDITLNQELCKPYFLSYTLENSPKVKRQIESCKHGAVMSAINKEDVKNLKIELPSIKAQMYFEKVYHQVENIQKYMEEEIHLLEELRLSLLAKFFKDIQISVTGDSLQTDKVTKDLTDIEALIKLIDNGGFSDLSNYDEMRSLLYKYIDEGTVEQFFDTYTQKVKIRKNETH